MHSHHNRSEERGAALLAALMMLVVVSAVAVFIARATTATANDIQQHTSTQDEYWAAKSMAETVEASSRTDLPTAYDLEMRLARSATYGTNLAVFDPPSIPLEQTRPVYDPNAWVVTFKTDGTIAVSGSKVRGASGATSLFGNLALWLNTHKSVPITYAANRGCSPTRLNLTLNEAYRLTPAAGTAEPQYVVQFGIDANTGAGGRVRQTGLITLGPPVTLTPDDPCSNLAASLSSAQLSGKGGSISYVLTITYTRATHLNVTAANSGTLSTLYDQDVADDPNPQTITVNTPTYSSRTVFTLTASNRSPSGSTCSVVKQVTVQDCPPGTFSFTAAPTSIQVGQSSTLSWNVTGATSVTIVGPNVNYTGGASGSLVVKPTVTSTYNLTSASSGGAGCPGASGSVTVVVCTNTPVINSFQAQPTTISQGQSSTLSWNVSNADSITISPVVGSVNATGSTPVSPQTTTTYTITATSTCGTVSATVTVTVCTGPPTINSFSVSPLTIAPGDTAVISWDVSGATLVQITPSIGTVNSVGQFTVSPPQTTSYTLIAQNPCGQRNRTITLRVDDSGGGAGAERKVWCDNTVSGTTTQYTRVAVTPSPGGYMSVSGVITVRNTNGFPCSALSSYQDRGRPSVWMVVGSTGFQRYDATSCCFQYGPGPEFSIFVTVDLLFLDTDTFGDSMSVQGGITAFGSNGCTFDYNYSVSPYARGNCPPRGAFGLLKDPVNDPSRELAANSVKREEGIWVQRRAIDIIFPPRRRACVSTSM